MALEIGDALENTGLAGAIQREVEAVYGAPHTEEMRENAAKFHDALAKAIIEHILANMDIAVSTTVTNNVGTGTGTVS